MRSTLGLILVFFLAFSSRAEDVGNQSESIYDTEIRSVEKKNERPSSVDPDLEIQNISHLDKLVLFQDIAVLQKRYLPKTERFEFFPNFGIIANNAFFLNSYFQGRLGYAFTEKWAVELIASMFMDSKYKVTQNLEKKSVKTQNLILPEKYYGLDVRWTPLYGKMGFFSRSIIPFDMYFSLGAGLTSTNESSTPFTVHVGTGQIYAIKKWMAFRWDLSLYHYTSQTQVGVVAGQPKREDTFNDFQLSVGMSFFFPEASYR